MRFLWLTKDAVLQFHHDAIEQDGGSRGVRDQGLLESALARPQNIYAYNETVSVFELGASYAYGIVKNHPFVDGNKRSALLACYTFLGINGIELDAPESDVVTMMVALAASDVSEADFALWLQKHSIKTT